nr:angiopoietin-2-like [Paramormyrops kingsleyae]
MTVLLLQGRVLVTVWSLWLASGSNETGIREGTHASLCGEYSSRATANGTCRLVATVPQLEGRRCPDLFRCTDEVSYWLHENDERKQQMADLKETISELQEELRNHRHRINVLELQNDDKNGLNLSLGQRFHAQEQRNTEAGTLLHIHGALIYDMQMQIRNLSMLVEKVRHNPGCMVNIIRTSPLLSTQEALHPEVQHVRNCPIDCASLYYNGVHRSGIYIVVPSLRAVPVEVFCDMETEGGGWTVIQRRQDGSVNFNRSWKEYREGFGDLKTEFWLGNEHIHEISNQGDYKLRIDLEDWKSKHKHALYENFRVDDEESRYRLHVSGFSGTIEDSFSWYHDKQSFSTPDVGNICAEIAQAGWWYHHCFYANLNGVYYKGGRYSAKGKNLLGPNGIVWYTWKDSDYYSLKKIPVSSNGCPLKSRLIPGGARFGC